MKSILLALGLISFTGFAYGDEGMWTLDNLPLKALKTDYNFTPSAPWLTKVQKGSLKLGNGCSASFVSGQGLVMTNHHCSRGCLQELSTAKNDLISKGFHSKAFGKERQCPALEVKQLLETKDVTPLVNKATRGLKGQAYSEAKKAIKAKLEKQCIDSGPSLHCDTVTLYQGGQYKLYKYRRFKDVRLVFAPEQDIASFGGDPDNFNFPRYALDFTFLRIYENGKPYNNSNFLKWAKKDIQPGEMTFIPGHPYRTERLLTIAELEYRRDFSFPERIFKASEMRGLLYQYMKKGKEFARTAKGQLDRIENSLKSGKGQLKALQDKVFFRKLVQQEEALKKKVFAKRSLKSRYGKAWTEMENAVALAKNHKAEIHYIAKMSFGSSLFTIAKTLVRAAEEIPKPNSKRLRNFSDARLPRLKRQLMSPAPIYKDLEKHMLEFSFLKMREDLSPDHPFVKKVLGQQSPEQLAQSLVEATDLDNISLRKKLFDGGKSAILKSKDPLIALMRRLDSDSRKKIQFKEDKIDAPMGKSSEKIAQVKFEIYGTDSYPDATSSLRVSYGKVKGYTEQGRTINPVTNIAGLYKRHTGASPFALPRSWIKSKSALDPQAPFNFVSTNDIIGGNSGSPVINRDGDVVGLVFDGNIHSLGGAFGYDERANRAVSVSASLILRALETVYGAQELVREIQGTP